MKRCASTATQLCEGPADSFPCLPSAGCRVPCLPFAQHTKLGRADSLVLAHKRLQASKSEQATLDQWLSDTAEPPTVQSAGVSPRICSRTLPLPLLA